MNSNYFYELNKPYQNIEAVKKYISTAEWQWIPYMTVASNFYETIHSDPFIKDIATEFNGRLKLYKFPAKQVYHWHKDANIGCSLNMVLEEYNSHSLFTHPERDNMYVEPIVELKYKPETWYIFNSQERHTVINLDDRDRILFTLIMPKGTNYHDVVNWYKKYSKK
jgi:hypothetical protein